MNEFLTYQRARRIALFVDVSFLVIHLGLFITFRLCGVVPLAWFNVISVLIYLANLKLLHDEKLRTFCVTTYAEVVLHNVLAMCILGPGSCFQLSLVTACILLYYAEYVGRCLELNYLFADPMALLGLLCYLFGVIYSHFVSPTYILPGAVALGLQCLWGIIVFLVAILFLRMFVNLAARSGEVLSDRVTHDKLTGLPNRYYMSAYLDETKEHEYLPGYWAAMADIDNFKHVNDTYGHNCGDYVLSTVARLLREGKGKAELCRWGGEEFLIVGRVGGDMYEQIALLERLRLKVAEHEFSYEGQMLHVTITIGVARYEEGMSMEEWINLADQKLYKGKCNGKNQVVS